MTTNSPYRLKSSLNAVQIDPMFNPRARELTAMAECDTIAARINENSLKLDPTQLVTKVNSLNQNASKKLRGYGQ